MNWRNKCLGDFVTLQRGHDLPDQTRRPGKIPVMGSFGLTGWHDEARAKGPGVTIGRSGASFGVVNYCVSDFWPLNTALYVIDFHGNDERFAYYLLRSIDFSRFNSGSAQPSLNRNYIHPIPIRIPPLPEQKRIAHILGTLDDKIELNRRMNETLESMARALFKSWFVDFLPVRANMERKKARTQTGDPVRAKAAGKKPDLSACGLAQAGGMDDATAALFPDSFVDSELGKIPKGWRVTSLSEITSVITKGTTPTKQDIDAAINLGESVNYIRVNTIEADGSLLYDKLISIPKSVHLGVLKRSILYENDVLYTIAGTIGRFAIVEPTILPANTNQAVAIIRPKETIPPHFLAFTLREASFQEELHSNIVHAVQANLSLGMLSKARAVLPPIESIFSLFNPIDKLAQQVSLNRKQSRTLTIVRDALLPKLLSGELDSKAEVFLERI